MSSTFTRAAMAALALAVGLAANAAEIRQYASGEQGFAVNSWLVPTKTGLVVVDTQFTVSEAEALAREVLKTRRPLQAVVITHPHPDHFNGTCRLLQIAKVPVYATAATIEGIRATAEAKRVEWKPTYGKDYPDTTCFPSRTAPDSGVVRIDGTDFDFHDEGPGEATRESVVRVASLKAAFVGDIVYNHMHPWLAEGRSALWLAQLNQLPDIVPASWRVYPGHGAAGSTPIIAAQREYIVSLRAAIADAVHGASAPGDLDSGLSATWTARYPGWPLGMLVPLNVAAVRKELADATRMSVTDRP